MTMLLIEKYFWKPHLQSKVLLFSWKCLKNTFTFRSNLKSKLRDICKSCHSFDKGEELIEHALFLSIIYIRAT